MCEEQPSLRGLPPLGGYWGWSWRSARSAAARIRLWASTCHKTIDKTFGRPRTRKCSRPWLRKSALTHSAVAARSL